ncbi:hypothetical protein AB0N62_39245 [Streptomyces sp. NPDC093982]|uniref:hypothetical protein n=1 Tax=Streptomyces sp. NPDC093982 TaxID=3155077 RepID=UPI00343683E0
MPGWLHFQGAIDRFLAHWPETAVKTTGYLLMESYLSSAARETVTACGKGPAAAPGGRGRSTLTSVGLPIGAWSA